MVLKQNPLDEVKNLSTLIADRLAEMVQAGELKPGERLVQTDLAARFGVSRVAIRDALHKLRRRGLVDSVPRKGTIVRSISCRTVRDLFAVRRALETLAAREACEKMPEEAWDRLERIVERQEALATTPEMAALLEADWEFHRTIYAYSTNEPLKEIVAGVWSRTRQARGLAQCQTQWGQEWGHQSAGRHRRILDALRRRDADAVERLVDETIALAEEELVEGLRQAGWGEEEEA